ncbi:hypothetical protein EC396_06120 [Lutibacter sp. HS1-25]|uniref:hypothetical protein n=1 Tax=Lutibacter sp. HS1-25 TaxID=2485000 RepID=UPI0010131BEE|nr:hypothetical protein [Lutibacter sp. HS1-25]RXP58634.1 hypothetical protein EC396_06120 [Lutibacter sp. HS1-25]
MKNLVKKGLVVAMLFTAMIATAAGKDNSVKFTVVNSKLIDLKLENKDGEIQVRVKDIHGETLHSEKFKGSNFAKKYDLKILPTGHYYFEIEGKSKIKMIPFEVTDNNVTYNIELETIYYKPTISQEKGVIHISKFALNNESLTIAFLDDNDNLLYTETIVGPGKLQKNLNIKQLEAGSYRLFVRSGNRVYSEIIKIDNE